MGEDRLILLRRVTVGLPHLGQTALQQKPLRGPCAGRTSRIRQPLTVWPV